METSQGVARLNDLDDVNNPIVDSVSKTVFADTINVALKNSVMGNVATDSTDDHAHLIQGSATVFVDGKPVAYKTAKDSDNHQIVQASQTVFVDGTPDS